MVEDSAYIQTEHSVEHGHKNSRRITSMTDGLEMVKVLCKCDLRHRLRIKASKQFCEGGRRVSRTGIRYCHP